MKERKLVKVFPDYCSTGLWLDGVNVDPIDLEVPIPLEIALKYWHEVWEFMISEGRMSPEYIKRWNNDGQRLALCLDDTSVDYKFEYVETKEDGEEG